MEYKVQPSLFEDDLAIEAAIQNLIALREKAATGDLSEIEKRFISGCASIADRTQPPIQPEKLVGKKINPFARMMMSAAETVTKAKKAFSIWTKKEPEIELEKVEPYVSNREEMTVSAVEKPYVSIKEKIMAPVTAKMTSSFESLNSKVDSINAGAQAGKQKLNKAVDGVTEKVATKVDELSNFIEQKRLNINEKFFEIYDSVTVARLNAQATVQEKVENFKSSLKNTKESVSKFAEMFEEPWITIKGSDKIPSLADISYNVGLFAGKSKQKLSDSLDGFVATLIKKQNPKNVIEEAFVEVKQATANNKDVASVNNPIEPQNSRPFADAPVVESVKQEETIIGTKLGALPTDLDEKVKAAMADMAARGEKLGQKEYLDKGILSMPEEQVIGTKLGDLPKDLDEKVKAAMAVRGEKLEQKEYLDKGILSMPEEQIIEKDKSNKNTEDKPSLLSKIRDLFVKENKLKNNFNVNQDEKEILLPQFKRLPDGSLPNMVDIFRGTEASLEKKIGLSVFKNGGYYFPALEQDGVTNNDRLMKIRDDIVPKYLDELRDAAKYLYQVNEKSKKEPEIKAFGILSSVLGGDKEAKNYLERSKTNEKDKKFLEGLGVPGIDKLLSDVDQSLFKINDNEYHLRAAKFNLAVLNKVGDSIRTELLFLRGNVPEYKDVIDKINNSKLFKDMTVNQVCATVAKSNFDETLNDPVNEGLVLRMNALQLKNQQSVKDTRKAKEGIEAAKINKNIGMDVSSNLSKTREQKQSPDFSQQTTVQPEVIDVSKEINRRTLAVETAKGSFSTSWSQPGYNNAWQGDLSNVAGNGMTYTNLLQQQAIFRAEENKPAPYVPPSIDMSPKQHLPFPTENDIVQPAVGLPPMPPKAKDGNDGGDLSITKPSRALIDENQQVQEEPKNVSNRTPRIIR